MGLNAGLAGKKYPVLTYEVTADAIRKYSSATNEVNPVFSGEQPVAPPAFPIVAAGEAIRTIFADPDLGVNMARLVHGFQEHRFSRPLRAGDVLSVQSRLEDVAAGEAGESFKIVTDLIAGDGPVVEVLSTMVIRGTGSRARAAAAAQEAAGSAPPEPSFELAEMVDEDQTYRYADASGDHNEIHVDPEFAKNQARLPGVICHGMCTMAFAARAVLSAAAAGDPNRLRKISVEFSRPVFPGQVLSTRGWIESESGPVRVWAFETLNARGQVVLKSGRAQVD